MPNFMNVGSSLRKELAEDDDLLDYQFQQIYLDRRLRTPTTPDLVIEEDEEESESEEYSSGEFQSELSLFLGLKR